VTHAAVVSMVAELTAGASGIAISDASLNPPREKRVLSESIACRAAKDAAEEGEEEAVKKAASAAAEEGDETETVAAARRYCHASPGGTADGDGDKNEVCFDAELSPMNQRFVKPFRAGLYKLNAVDPELETARFQPLNL
jgi:hypothetical protein